MNACLLSCLKGSIQVNNICVLWQSYGQCMFWFIFQSQCISQSSILHYVPKSKKMDIIIVLQSVQDFDQLPLYFIYYKGI